MPGPQLCRARRHVLTAFCVFGLMTSCQSGPGRILHDLPESAAPPPTTPLTLFGYVWRDSTDTPLEGAQVFAPGPMQGALVDATGRYAFTVPEAGQYRVVAQLIGFRSDTFSVSVDSIPVRIDFALRELPFVLHEDWRGP